jgi:arsenate reductase
MLTVYAYQKCSTCRDAIQWLDAQDISYQLKAIRETPPSTAELASALKLLDGDLRKLFNTSGVDYRELGIKDKLPSLSESEALDLLASNGNLVKRPFVIGKGVAFVGFKPDAWKSALAR